MYLAYILTLHHQNSLVKSKFSILNDTLTDSEYHVLIWVLPCESRTEILGATVPLIPFPSGGMILAASERPFGTRRFHGHPAPTTNILTDLATGSWPSSSEDCRLEAGLVIALTLTMPSTMYTPPLV